MLTTTQSKKGHAPAKSVTQTTTENDTALALYESRGESRVDSRVIAAHLGVQHESSMRSIIDYADDFKTLGILRFEIGEIQGRGQPERFVLLNEDQCYLLLAYSRNTDRVRALKLPARLPRLARRGDGAGPARARPRQCGGRRGVPLQHQQACQ